ncbi:MAG: prephenate dehydrogenase/arogenate dehydrogenase family protein [Akkermansia sp.]|nr:prephenate dehydrogenase/arogenate dehydrogenase family protein [Akkermansia sp.]
MAITTVTLLGCGLLGGSIALAARNSLPETEVRIWARREATLQYAREHGFSQHTYTDLQEAVRGAQLVILATPIAAFQELAERMLPALGKDTIVTDIGSVKAYVHRTTGAWLTERGHCFIGSHPMAGSEFTGIENALEDMLTGATVAITNPHGAPQEQVARLVAFWQGIGCSTYRLEPVHHDQAVARISHVPHILAGLCARTAVAGEVPHPNLRRLAASGFRDTTRVCSGPAAMWADILWENDSAIRATLQDCVADLHHLIYLLEIQDKAAVQKWLEDAAAARHSIRKGGM